MVVTEAVETAMTQPADLEAGKPKVSALEGKALRASIWTFVSYGVRQCLRVVNSLVLTRLLLPAAFGETQLVTVLIVGMAMFTDIGLEPSIIQSQRGDEPDFLNTAWTLQSLRGIALWLLLLLLAYPASLFYHDPLLLKLIPVLSLSMVITGFNSTGLLTLSRHMDEGRIFWIDLSTQIAGLLVTVGWALWSPSVWALVAGNTATNLTRLALSHHRGLVPGHRNRFQMHRPSFQEISKFGRWIVLGTAFFFFASQGDRLTLGKLVSMSALGVYGIAYQISDVPRSIIQALSQKVGFPFVSRMSHLPREEFRREFLRYRGYALWVGAVLLAAMSVWGDLVIRKLYTARYYDAAWMIPILALGLWHTLMYTTTRPALFALGKSSYNAIGNAAFAIAILVATPLAWRRWGLFGAVIAIAAADLPLYAVTQFGCTRERLRPLWQDLRMTGVFLGFLLLDYFLRRAL